MKRTTFAWGLVGALLLPALSRAEEAGVVVLDRVGPTVRAQNDDKPKPPPAPASEALKPVPDTLPAPHGAHSMPMHGMPTTMYGDYGMVGGYGCCCSDEGLKPTGNPILDAPVELTTALFKGIFCGGCKGCKSCSRGRRGDRGGRGRYHMTYPERPWYFDQRDGQVYSAQGYGVPMAVPVAPCVRHTYNYSWGVPSSRITPLSRMPAFGSHY